MNDKRIHIDEPEELEANAPGLEEDPIPTSVPARPVLAAGVFGWLRGSPFVLLLLT